MKQLYTKRIVRSVLSKIDEDTSMTAATLSKTVPVLNAIQWVSSDIKEIKGDTVRKCFAMCVLGEHSQDTEFEDAVGSIAQLVELFRTAQKKVIIESAMTPEEFMQEDEDIPTCEEMGENWEEYLLMSRNAEQRNLPSLEKQRHVPPILLRMFDELNEKGMVDLVPAIDNV